MRIGAGVQAFDILAQGHAQNPPKVVVTGECPTVGIAGGFIQGGGHGPWSNLKGFSADNVLEFEVLTASGHFITVNADSYPDLFWALKGGGPASYAVIISVVMKTYEDLPSSGATLFINYTHTYDTNQIWKVTEVFHSYANHFVNNGIYVYYEIAPFTFRVLPFVAIDKTEAQLLAILQPMLDELDALSLPYEFASKSYPTFYELYLDLFEAENAADSALTGGWMFNQEDVALRNADIINAFKTVASPVPDRPDVIGILIGHIFNPGHSVPVANSATHPAWRNASDFVIAVLPVPVGASLAEKAYMQDVLTNTMDQAMRDVSSSGCTYVNEADPYQENWGNHFWGAENYAQLQQIRAKWDPKGVFYAISTPGTETWHVVEDGTRLCKKL